MQPYITRRTQLLQKIGPDGLAVLFAAPEQRRSNDTDFPFRQDSYFHYLSGFPEPEAIIVLDGAKGSSTLYCRGKDPLRETWDGFRYGPSAAVDAFAFDEATTSGNLPVSEPIRPPSAAAAGAVWAKAEEINTGETPLKQGMDGLTGPAGPAMRATGDCIRRALHP